MGEPIGYAGCSNVRQDLAAQREILPFRGVGKGLTGTNRRARSGLDHALGVRQMRTREGMAGARSCCDMLEGKQPSADMGLDNHRVVELKPGRYRARARSLTDDGYWMVLVNLQPTDHVGNEAGE